MQRPGKTSGGPILATGCPLTRFPGMVLTTPSQSEREALGESWGLFPFALYLSEYGTLIKYKR